MALDIANTVLNASPYFDDYSEEKKFHRILFRPAVAVQARELNQVQSIFQNQIERLGNHLFKDGTIIKGCGIAFLNNIDYVSINDRFEANDSLASTNTQFVNAIAVGNTSGVVAQIIAAREGFSSSSTPARFFIKYTQPGFSNERTFQEGEYLNVYQPGKSYIDKVILQVNSAVTVNTTNFPISSKVSNPVSLARGFIVNAYANGSGNFLELRNVRKSFFNGDELILSTDPNVTAEVLDVDYESFANSFIDSVRVLASNAGLYDSLGFAYGVTVSPGIIFHKGHFIRVDSHITIVNENENDPTGKVLYFNTEEQIIKETDDTTLFDNASGTTNINAPGAHRLKLNSVLISRDKTGANSISNTDIAFPIVEFGEDGPIFQKTNTEYNILGEELAKRTFEESGHYIVQPFNVSTKPHGSDRDLLIYELTQGLAYVRGRRIEFLNNQNIPGRKGIDTLSEAEKAITMAYGNYVVVNDVKGYFPVDQSSEVVFYNAEQNAISGTAYREAGSTANGSIIGYANVRAIRYVESTSTKKSAADAQYRLYIFNFRPVGSYTFQDARSVVYHSGTANSTNTRAFADLVLNSSSVPTLEESSLTPLFFALDTKAVKDLKAANGVSDTNYYYTGANTTQQILAAGTLTFGVGAAKGKLGISGTSSIAEDQIDIIVVDANCSTTSLTGTVAASATNVITGTGTTFLADFVPGECIRFVGLGSAARIVSIASNTSMTVNTAVTVVANTYTRVHLRGSTIALNPAAGTKRTITVAPDGETATVNFGDTYDGTANVVVRYYGYNNESAQIQKDINRNSLVIIDTSNNVNGSAGPWSLGVPDVLKLNAVYVGTNTSSFDINTNRVNQFILDNGQRDTHYDHASISLNPQSGLSSIANSYLLVVFDCFTANTLVSGEGFFSVESYPVNDLATANNDTTVKTWEIPSYKTTVANTEVTYDLRDVIDFRPYKANTANVTTTYTAATVNPTSTNTFNTFTTSYNPFPASTLTTNFTYYLGRKDRLVLTSEGLFKIEEGIPAINPRLSPANPDVLNIAEVNIPAYPSLTDAEKFAIDRKDNIVTYDILSHKRFTMRDISLLEQRIQRLEYYTTLNMLESIALQTTVADTVGNPRFQNGFFVDPFNSHIFGRTNDEEYKIAIDEKNGLLRPPVDPQIIEMEFDSSANSYSGVQVTGDMVTLAYESIPYIDQPHASDVVNVSGVPITWNGTIDIRPMHTNEIEYLAPPAAVSSTSKVAQAYNSMVSVTPGMAQYGWWREAIQNTEDYAIKRFENDARDVTSTPIQSTKDITTETGEKIAAGILYFSKQRVYGFRAVGLKPNTIHYLFINNNNNSDFAALGELSTTPNAGDEKFVVRTTPWGVPLESDSRGEIIGKFITPKFSLKSGTHKLTIRNRQTISSGLDESIAEGYFTVDISLVLPPVLPPDANTPPPPDANTPAPPKPRANTLPDLVAKFVVSGNTTIYSEANSTGYYPNGEFTLTFTNDSYISNGSITGYNWNFGTTGEVVIATPNTAAGVGPHNVTFKTYNSVQDVNVTLTVTDSFSRTSEHTQVVRLTKLPSVPTIKQPVPNTVPESAQIRFLTTALFDYDNSTRNGPPHSYYYTNRISSDSNYSHSFNTITALGSNTVLTIKAKPSIDYEGDIRWTITNLSGPQLTQYSQANLLQVFVSAFGSGYSNTDTVRFSNGQVDALGTIVTDNGGKIVRVNITSKGNFTDGTAATTETFTANSTVFNNFTLSTSSTNTSILVTVNGLVQKPSTDYQITGGGTTLNFTTNLDFSVSPDVVTVYYNAPSVTPGTVFKTPEQIRVQIANTTHPANSTNGNTSGGTGAAFQLILGTVYDYNRDSIIVSGNTINLPNFKVSNGALALYSSQTPGAQTTVLVTAELYLANGYATPVGNSSLIVTLKNSTEPYLVVYSGTNGQITTVDNGYREFEA